MSGGSFNYLSTTDQLDERTVQEMADYLRRNGKFKAAEATERVVFHLRQAKAIQRDLEKVWHAAEWWCSGDSGEECLDKAIDEWEGDDPL